MTRLVDWAGLSKGKYYDWVKRYGKSNEHNASIPRDHWLTGAEKQAILAFHDRHPLEGYRRLTFMMLDQDVVAVSPSSVYRVLRAENRLDRWNRTPSKKGTGFVQPLEAHQHWHIDIAYINIGGTFYYLCSVLDGCSRFIVHWEIRESMKEADVELVLERARERFPEASPRIISDNGPQFIANDFKAYIRLAGMTHVRIAPYYPQSKSSRPAADRALAQDAQGRRHPHQVAELAEGGPPHRPAVRRLLQRDQAPLRHRLHRPRRPPARPSGRHLGRARPQARRSPGAPSRGPPGGSQAAAGCGVLSQLYDHLVSGNLVRYEITPESGSRCSSTRSLRRPLPIVASSR